VVRTSLALALVAWGPTVGLAALEAARGLPLDPVVLAPRTHVRWLVAAPLLLAFLAVLERFVNEVVRWLRTTELLPVAGRGRLDAEIRSTGGLLRSTVVDGVLVTLAVLDSLPDAARADAASVGWTVLVGAGGFRALGLIVLVRWLLWGRLVCAMAWIGVDPSPLHPDGAGGVRVLAIPARGFGLVVAAFGAVVSASFSTRISAHGAGLPELGEVAATYTVAAVLLGLGPLLALVPAQARARLRAQLVHGGFAERYARDFDAKWLASADPGSPLGSGDIQSLADTQASMGRALAMGLLPFGRDTLLVLTVCALLPFVPCVLLLVPVAEVARWLAGALT
jgi:hypothetical protein